MIALRSGHGGGASSDWERLCIAVCQQATNKLKPLWTSAARESQGFCRMAPAVANIVFTAEIL